MKKMGCDCKISLGLFRWGSNGIVVCLTQFFDLEKTGNQDCFPSLFLRAVTFRGSNYLNLYRCMTSHLKEGDSSVAILRLVQVDWKIFQKQSPKCGLMVICHGTSRTITLKKSNYLKFRVYYLQILESFFQQFGDAEDVHQ